MIPTFPPHCFLSYPSSCPPLPSSPLLSPPSLPLQYEIVVLWCHLKEDVTSAGGYLKAEIDSEIFYPYREEPDEVR